LRARILAVVCGLALPATPLQAAPVPTKPPPGELGAAPSLVLVRDGCGRGWLRTRWRDQWGYGMGVAAFRTKVVLMAVMARGRSIRPRLAHRSCTMGLELVTHSKRHGAPNPSLAEDPERLTLRQVDQVPTRTPL
jgi:hypothetical protein